MPMQTTVTTIQPMTDPTLRRLVAAVFIVGGCTSLAIGIYDRSNNIATDWDTLWNPVTSTIYILSGLSILLRPEKTTLATVFAFLVTSIYQLGIHFYALHRPGPVTYYALASSSSFDPLAYIALFIAIPHLALRLSCLHCAALYALYFGGTMIWPLSTEGVAAEHLVIASLLSHPGYIVALRYIVKLQHQLAEAQIAVFRSKAEFLAMLSHEIRNLLQTLVSTIDLLQFKVRDEKSQLAIERMQKTALQLQTCLRDANELTTFDNPSLQIEHSAFDVRTLLNDARELLESKAAAKGIDLTLLEAQKPLIVSSDRERLRQVIENLLNNSIKYTEHGQVTLSAENAPSNTSVKIKVKDTGIGISAAYQKRIFLPYVRLNNRLTSSEPGSGLGLPIVQKIVAALGGSIELVSQAGEGSTFTVTIPSQE